MEIWKKIKDYDNYYISNLGNVRYNYCKLKLYKDKDGYLQVYLNHKLFKVHRLVALAFIPNPDNLEEVNHINQIKNDNRVENLEWINHKDNTQYSCAHKVSQYSLSGVLLNTFNSIRDAATLTGTDRKSIALCCKCAKNYKTANGFIWKYA